MENWGLITFTPEFILCDEYSTLQTKMDVAETVAHEIAHQWFGNLVTMNWWDDLWLNEGFATFISMIAMDLRFPDWSYFNTYITEDYDDGLERDSMHTSHPIQAAVKIPSEINDIFDDITYSKASGVIRMLYYFVGKETFNIGVSSYLKSFSYQNAVSEDLWDHLGKSSGINISSLMKTWITQVGYPLLRVLEEKYNEKNQEMTITLRQERFLTSQNFNVTDSNSLWSIPLGLKTNEKDYNFLMCKKEETFTFKYKKDKNSYWKMNNQLYGFFRVLLNPEESIKLCRMNDLPPSEKIGLISDSFALARAGLTSIADSLELLNEFLSEDDTIASILQNLISIIYKEDTKVLHSLKKFQKKIFYRHLKIVGWEYIENEDHFTQLKRTVVILSLADVGEESVIMEFDARMKKYMNGELGALNSNLVQKGLDLHLQSSKNQLEEIKRLLHLYATSPNDDVKVQSLQSLGCTSSPEAIDYLLKDALLNLNVIKSYDVRTVLYNLTYSSPIPLIVKPLLWKWFKKNWDVLVDRYYTTKGSLKAILVICTSTSVDKEFISEIKSWAAGEDCTEEIVKQKRLLILKSLKSKLEYSLEEIENNARFIEISKSELLKWAELNK
ncbi:Aminopeptidase 2 mitochondrial [Lobulomyces angularis]|nr:Aminopeptidase 2 mitochondrial [Lobulomyces angularis]